jgi:hypothetical protein
MENIVPGTTPAAFPAMNLCSRFGGVLAVALSCLGLATPVEALVLNFQFAQNADLENGTDAGADDLGPLTILIPKSRSATELSLV